MALDELFKKLEDEDHRITIRLSGEEYRETGLFAKKMKIRLNELVEHLFQEGLKELRRRDMTLELDEVLREKRKDEIDILPDNKAFFGGIAE